MPKWQSTHAITTPQNPQYVKGRSKCPPRTCPTPQYGKDFYRAQPGVQMLPLMHAHPPACTCLSPHTLPLPCLPSTPQYGKDFYYRAHPDDLKQFYAAVDEFHRIYDVVTEFESLNGLASEVLPGEWSSGSGALAPIT